MPRNQITNSTLRRLTPMRRTGISRKPKQGSLRWNGASGPAVKPRKRQKRIRPRSKKAEELLPEVLALRNGYKARNSSKCEILELFPRRRGVPMVPIGEGRQRQPVNPDSEEGQPSELHHIYCGKPKYEAEWNYIHLGFWTHKFCTRWKREGLILCLWIKFQKGEFDLEAAQKAMDKNPLGFISEEPPKFVWMMEMWLKLTGCPEIP